MATKTACYIRRERQRLVIIASNGPVKTAPELESEMSLSREVSLYIIGECCSGRSL